jgi:hypothetical protein
VSSYERKRSLTTSFRVANAGSFIRPTSRLSFGSSFLQALKAKYIADSTTLVEEEEAKQYGRRNLADIRVEAPNMDNVIKRSAQLHKLREVGLGGWKVEADASHPDSASYADVARAFDDTTDETIGDIAKTCPNVRGLDLSRSLLPSWQEVSRIAAELPMLESLSLHFNRFADVSPTTLPLPNAFSRLLDLRVDGTLISWDEIVLLSDAFPNLENLQMGSNNLRRLDGGQTNRKNCLSKLKVLNLEGNALSDWDDIWSSMEECPALERLILSSNKLSSISISTQSNHPSQVKHISVWDNPISSWSDVDALDACVGGLGSLVMGGDLCVLTREKSMQDIRLIAIARLSNLRTFNNAPVLATERREAELYYISLIEKERLAEEEIRLLHPRWSQLCQSHGISNDNNEKGQGMNGNSSDRVDTLKSKLLIVKVHLSTKPPSSQPPYISPPTAAAYSTHSVELKLLTTTPLRLLKSKLSRPFSLKKGPQSILSIWALLSPTLDPLQSTAQLLRNEMRPQETAPSNERITYEMDGIEKSLHGYNFSHGDEIVLIVAQD